MKISTFRSPRKRSSESGQTMLFVLLGLGVFMIGAIAFAVDMSNVWFHRQNAQSAADAACTAGAMDLLRVQTNNITAAPYPGHFTPGTNFDCSATTPNSNGVSTTNPAPCVYAALNGYPSSLSQATAAGGTLGDNVNVIFDGAAAPGVTATRLMEVDIIDNVPTFFAGMLRGRTTQAVRAVAKCGISQVASPIPLIVLDPVNPTSNISALDIQGNPNITIYGGPQQSIQINSVDAAAASVGGSALIDLSQGGPSNSGSSLGVTGGPTTPPTIPSNFNPGTSGQWMSPHSPIQDPYQNTTAPTTTGLTTYAGDTSTTGSGALKNPGAFDAAFPPPGGWIADGTSGCSAKGGGQCGVFLPGNYTNGICLGNSCGSGAAQYAVFQEGLYYMGGVGLFLKSDSCARMYSVANGGTWANWGGVIFYFSGTATLNVDSNSGNTTSGCDGAQTYNTATGAPTGFGVSCDSNSSGHVPANLPATLNGNVLLAPCRGTWGDTYLASGLTPPSNPGTQRGILFFQDRSAKNVQSAGGGGGTYAMAGTFYFHSCRATATAGTNGLSCTVPGATPPTYYSDTLTITGNSGGSAYILGEIITDNLDLNGGGSIYMDLNPTTAQNIYKAALYQ
jgi:Putative Flp pilus-assembly TadE/G-like